MIGWETYGSPSVCMGLPPSLSVVLRNSLSQAAVLEDALDGIQDSPMLSTDMNNAQHLSPTKSGAAGGGGHSAHGSSDGNVRRLESLRELLSVALNRRPDLPLGLCVKSEFIDFFE